MSKRKKRGQWPGIGSKTPEALAQEARQHLDFGRWRDAIQAFKELLKQEASPEHQRGLAEAYAGRAEALLDKGMIKEARTIWENRTALGEAAQVTPEHADLLLQLGRISEVLTLYKAAVQSDRALAARLGASLAAQVLAGDAKLLAELPAEEPIRAQAAVAQEALTAYCEGRDEALQQALTQIPFRSPYRDLAIILKALLHLPGQPRDCLKLLESVKDASPFLPLRDAARLATLPDDRFLSAIATASPEHIDFAATLKGWPAARITLAWKLSALDPESSSRALLQILRQHKQRLGTEWMHRAAANLYLNADPGPAQRELEPFIRNLPHAERVRMLALLCTDRMDPWEALQAWQNYADEILEQSLSKRDPKDLELRAALALRHTSRLHGLLKTLDPRSDYDGLGDVLAEKLETSLELDPEDQETYLQLIDWYRRGNDLKSARHWLALAQKRWPSDMTLLEAGLEIALDANSFKKAASLARQILEIDPINSGARSRLVDAHLSHLCKQFRRGRLDLAHKELDAAEAWATGAGQRQELTLTRGFLELAEPDQPVVSRLEALIAQQGGGFAGQVSVALAGYRMDIEVIGMYEQHQFKQSAVIDRDDLIAVLDHLHQFVMKQRRFSQRLIDWLNKGFTKAPWKTLNRSETEFACETLSAIMANRVRSTVARAALKRWKREPIFELHLFEACHSDNLSPAEPKDLTRLRAAMARAFEQGDSRTGHRIQLVLDRQSPRFYPVFDDADQPFDDVFDEIEENQVLNPAEISQDPELLREIMKLLPPDQIIDSLGLPPNERRRLQKLLRTGGPDALLEDIIQEFNRVMREFDGENSGPPTQQGVHQGESSAKIPSKPGQNSAAPHHNKRTPSKDKPKADGGPKGNGPDQLELF